MDSTRIIELISYSLPTIIMAFVAYSFFELYTKNENAKRNYLLQKESKPDTLSLRLQAYERMTLFLERINPSQLLVRISPISENKTDYQNFVIAQIEQEYEHNLAQQIYVSNECWSTITTAKNATIQMILLAAKSEKISDAHQLRELILNDLLTKPSPSSIALEFLKNEVSQLW
ncbi:hypothetical protein C3L50_12280 [Flavobacterium alvei]|uniref:Uncharacterized protein n=1 Tax=Flavobacterium alvei TaxID=2080416 RepID=A0A2S5A8G5_9FLAO|nr:hypothetical protein [Flavobacterium alvei]POY38890.1 hypothetical protein C3L50_12280 [Flavobacterium alvei]HQE34641.1 hypothetical protein [Flavobacterium alvei]HQF49091.1 hypothetical protein [Flavobacterium alvei]